MVENISILEALKIVTESIKAWTDDDKVAKTFGKGLSTNDFTNEYKTKVDDALQEETDPTVPAWAKEENKPTYTASEVGALPADTVIPSLDGYATEEYVDDEISSMPISISEDGYSEVINQRKITHIQSVKSDDGINIVISMEGNKNVVLNIGFNENNYPESLTVNGHTCTFGWSGF